jgi:hypothetical protein
MYYWIDGHRDEYWDEVAKKNKPSSKSAGKKHK